MIDVAADATTDLRPRLGAVGAAARVADEIFVSRLPQPTVPQPMFAEDERQRRLLLTQAVGTRMDRIGQILHDSILPTLAQKESISVVALDSLTEPQRGWLRDCFMQQVFPLLTPLAVDSGRPFPHLDSGSLTLLTVLHSREADPRYDSPVFALIQVPDVLERWLSMGENGQDPQAGRWFDAQAYGPGALRMVRECRAFPCRTPLSWDEGDWRIPFPHSETGQSAVPRRRSTPACTRHCSCRSCAWTLKRACRPLYANGWLAILSCRIRPWSAAIRPWPWPD